MNNIILQKTWVQGRPVAVDNLLGTAFTGEAEAHTFIIKGVDAADQTVPISGDITGRLLASNNVTVPLTGTIENGCAVVTLTEDCYYVPGKFIFSVYSTDGDTTICLYCAVGNIFRTASDIIEYPSAAIPDVAQLIEDLQYAIDSFPADLSGLLMAIAPSFNKNTAYSAGDYVWYYGGFYKFTVDHPAGNWNPGHVVDVHLADDVADFGGAIDGIDATIGNTPMGTTATTITGAIAEHETDIGGITTQIGSTPMGTTATTVTGAIKEHTDSLGDLKSAFDVSDDYTKNKLHSIETVINGKPQIYADYQSGRYIQSGYTNSLKDYVNSRNLLEAGTYSFVTTMGDAYYFGLFQYVSDTSGVLVQGLNDVNRLNQVVPEGTKVTVRKMAGTPITEEDIKYIYENLIITKITNETNIIDSIDDINYHIDRIVTQGNLFDIKSVEYGKALSSGMLTDVADRITSDYIDVHYLNQIYHSGMTLQLAFYDQNKTFISQVQNPASPFSTVVYNKNAYYIRVTIHSDNASTYYICPTATVKHDYMFYPTHGIGGVDCSQDFAKLVHDNSIDSSNTFAYSANEWVGCSGNLVFDHTLGEANGMYAINTVGTTLDLRRTLETPIDPTGICEIFAYVYIPDASKITDITLYALGTSFNRATRVFANGWNKLRFATYEGALTAWSSITAIRLYVTGEAGLEIVFAKCTFTRPDKANLIIIEDGGYSTFLEIGYPKFKAINVPITWALNPGRLGATSDASGHVLTQEEIDSIASDACAEFSFHSWDSTPTQNMTASQIQEDAIKCIRYLKKQGLCPQYLWRAAHVQNLATNANAEEGLVEALATGTAVSAYTTWPFVNRYNVPRTPFHGRNASYYTAMFDVLKKTHCTAVIYTHGVSDYSADITVDLLDEFIAQLTTAIGEGWINPTTYNRLRNETLVID